MQPSTETGAIFLGVSLPWPWPPSRPLNVKSQLSDGLVSVDIGVGRRIFARLIKIVNGDETIVSEVTSCRFSAVEGAIVPLFVEWDAHLRVRVGRDIVGSTDPADLIPKSYTPTYTRNPNAPVFDFSAKNAKAIASRRGKFGTQNGSPDVMAHLVASLKDEADQLRDLLALVRDSKTAHARGLAARLRLLLLRSGQKPLLQSTAALFDLPLIVYTAAGGRHRKLPMPALACRSDIAGSPNSLLRNPVDIDVWLGLPAIQIGDQEMSHEKVIADLGNTIGSHLDHNVAPSVLALRSFTMQFDQLVEYVVDVSDATLSLCEKVLSECQKPKNS